MKKFFSRLFMLLGINKETPCNHVWQLEPPTENVGNALLIWEGPVHDICEKCGARRLHPENDHNWQPPKKCL